jgi:hypothetical protein
VARPLVVTATVDGMNPTGSAARGGCA